MDEDKSNQGCPSKLSNPGDAECICNPDKHLVEVQGKCYQNSTQVGNIKTLRRLEISELYAGWKYQNSTQVGNIKTLRRLEILKLYAGWKY